MYVREVRGLEELNDDKLLSDVEAKYFLSIYEKTVVQRTGIKNQITAIKKNEPDNIDMVKELAYYLDNFNRITNNIQAALDKWVRSKPIGTWLMSICGIGAVYAASLLVYVDINKVQTAGQVQAYCGLDPNRKTKTYYNKKLKTICWQIGDQFLRQKNESRDHYGYLIDLRKEYEKAKNEKGDYADQAKYQLERKKYSKTSAAYKAYSDGKLPLGHIQERAKRYAVKIFLSHFFEIWYELEFKEKPPKPYAIDILNHAHKIEPPNKYLVL